MWQRIDHNGYLHRPTTPERDTMALANTNIDRIIREALAETVRKIAPAIARHVAAAAAEELEKSLALNSTKAARVTASRPRRAPREEMTKWVADRKARRVPKFVIELTGLDTKKKIVAKYGDNAAFEKGKPAPAAKGAPQKGARPSPAASTAARVVTSGR
jgi:histone H3/H4